MTGPAVLQIVGSLDAGGSERSTIDIAKGLSDRGWRALVASSGGRLERELREAGGALIRMPLTRGGPLALIANAFALARLIRQENVALVHARTRGPAWSAALASRMTGVPLVTTHHTIFQVKGPLRRFYNSVMARGDAVIANSHFTARHVAEIYGFEPKRLTVIHRGVDLSYFDPAQVAPERVAALRLRWGVAAGERVLFLPGRIDRWKGQLVFLDAIAALRRGGRLPAGVRAVIAGDPQGRAAYVAEIRAAIAASGLADIAVLADHVSDMAAAYLASDIVVSASTTPEAFGRIPPEAMAMGRLVAATNHGGTRETMPDDPFARLVIPGDAESLAEALADLLNAPPERIAAWRAKARAHVAAQFSVEAMRDATIALYAALLATRSRAGASAAHRR